MKKEKDLANYEIHTDLAIERISDENDQEEIIEDLKVITINDSEKGFYVTIEFEDVTDSYNQKILTKVFTNNLKKIMRNLKIKQDDTCLVIGLGNQNSTPDSLGPNVINKIVVTSHLFNLEGIQVDSNYLNVASFAPGVTSITGIETFEIVEAIVKKKRPNFLIVIDALVAKSLSRVNRIIQLSTSGIRPGSGIGRFQKELNQKSLGIPIISIGIPTVVDAQTIVNDTLDYLIKYSPKHKNSKSLENMNEKEVSDLLDYILSFHNSNLMVTPKEIDFVIQKLTEVIADGINTTLHKKSDL